MANTTTTQNAITVIFIVVVGVAGALAYGPAITGGTLAPDAVLGVLAFTGLIAVTAGRLFGSEQAVQEGITKTHVVVGIVWAVYLFAAVGFVVAGNTGWIVLGHLVVNVVGIVTALVLFQRQSA